MPVVKAKRKKRSKNSPIGLWKWVFLCILLLPIPMFIHSHHHVTEHHMAKSAPLLAHKQAVDDLHHHEGRPHIKTETHSSRVKVYGTVADGGYQDANLIGWSAADKICRARGNQRLCKFAQLCPNGKGGTPVYGKIADDTWIPAGDSDNSWVSVGGMYPDRMCHSHSDCCGMAPVWGEQGFEGGKMLCCAESGTVEISEAAVAAANATSGE
jgi:hypothetical protein